MANEASFRKNSELVKHSAAVHISGELNITQRKISNTLLKNAYNNLLNQDKHSMRISHLMEEIGYNSNNIDFLKSNIISLMSIIVDWNIMGKDNKNEWIASSLISSVKIKGGIIEYTYSPHMVELLANPNIYARLNLVIQKSIKSAHSLILWEFLIEALCSENKKIVNTPWMTIAEYKKLLGVKEHEYQQFKLLNHRLINEPLKEINSVADISAKAIYQKEGRKVVAISFEVKRKNNFQHRFNLVSSSEYKDVDNTDASNDNEEILRILKDEFAINVRKANALIKQYDLTEIQAALKFVKQQLQTTVVKNITAYTIKAIEEGWRLPEAKTDTALISVSLTEYENSITDKKWKKVWLLVKDSFDSKVLSSWITRLNFTNIKKDTVYYKAPSKFIQTTIETRYSLKLLQCWQEYDNLITAIKIEY